MKSQELGQHLDKFNFLLGSIRPNGRAAMVTAMIADIEERYPASSLIIRYQGDVGRYDIPFMTVSIGIITTPAEQWILLGEAGETHVVGAGVAESQKDISACLAKGDGPVDRGPLRELRTIDGKVYAVGPARQAYRRDAKDTWVRIDQGAQDPNVQIWEKSFHSIDGFSERDIYTVGWEGEIFRYDSETWKQQTSPTTLALYRVCCAGDGVVYACGQNGVLLRGKGNDWEMVSQTATKDDLWGLEFYKGKLYVASMHALYKLVGDDLVLVDFGGCPRPSSFYGLAAGDGLLWSVGAKDIVEFDGDTWSVVVGSMA